MLEIETSGIPNSGIPLRPTTSGERRRREQYEEDLIIRGRRQRDRGGGAGQPQADPSSATVHGATTRATEIGLRRTP